MRRIYLFNFKLNNDYYYLDYNWFDKNYEFQLLFNYSIVTCLYEMEIDRKSLFSQLKKFEDLLQKCYKNWRKISSLIDLIISHICLFVNIFQINSIHYKSSDHLDYNLLREQIPFTMVNTFLDNGILLFCCLSSSHILISI
jgi:hypothetical protein